MEFWLCWRRPQLPCPEGGEPSAIQPATLSPCIKLWLCRWLHRRGQGLLQRPQHCGWLLKEHRLQLRLRGWNEEIRCRSFRGQGLTQAFNASPVRFFHMRKQDWTMSCDYVHLVSDLAIFSIRFSPPQKKKKTYHTGMHSPPPSRVQLMVWQAGLQSVGLKKLDFHIRSKKCQPQRGPGRWMGDIFPFTKPFFLGTRYF